MFLPGARRNNGGVSRQGRRLRRGHWGGALCFCISKRRSSRLRVKLAERRGGRALRLGVVEERAGRGLRKTAQNVRKAFAKSFCKAFAIYVTLSHIFRKKHNAFAKLSQRSRKGFAKPFTDLSQRFRKSGFCKPFEKLSAQNLRKDPQRPCKHHRHHTPSQCRSCLATSEQAREQATEQAKLTLPSPERPHIPITFGNPLHRRQTLLASRTRPLASLYREQRCSPEPSNVAQYRSRVPAPTSLHHADIRYIDIRGERRTGEGRMCEGRGGGVSTA